MTDPTQTPPPPTGESGNTDTIDVTDLVEKMRQTWVTMQVNTVMALIATVPILSWLNWPVISDIARAGVTWVINALSKTEVQLAFFLNTAVRKASQAADYVDTLDAKASLPTNVSDADYKKAEENEMQAFDNFVRFTN